MAENQRPAVAVIGLGPMGAMMAETFLKAGYPTTVWNRTASKADALVGQGATLAASAAEAAAAADVTVISQTHYQAMYDSFGDGDLNGATLVNLSSGSPEELRKAGEWAAGRGAALLTGGIMTPPPGIGQPGAYVFYSGPEQILDEHRATLKVLADTTYVGPDLGLAMAFYQAQLFTFWSSLASFMHATALVGKYGVTPEAYLPFGRELFADLASEGPMGYAQILANEIAAGEFPGGENSLHMQAVGADHVVEASVEAGLDTAFPQALRDLFWKGVNGGLGEDGLGAVYRVVTRDLG
ncbi:NAD(P)-dependent oxidoreductase [Actinomadura hibisca]|uniref:NAD(P)-dependent oxidoreductase n=1 Tax=Actinomadura hibisca TaxID=68565 RepID=UPI0008316CB4|nr:NAD(P)-binding domain-containing protein [Actinomadura hibisca]